MYDTMGVSGHRVGFVGDDDLPPAQDFAFVQSEGELWLVLKESRISAALLEDVWSTYITMGRRESVRAGHVPSQGCCPLAGHALAV